MKNYQRVKQMAIILTSLFIIGFEFIRHNYLADRITPQSDTLISAFVFILGAIGFSQFVFSLIVKIEKKRQQKEREAKALFDNSVDGIFVFNVNWTLVDMNRGAETMSNWTIQESIGNKTIESLFRLTTPLQLDDFIDGVSPSMKVEEGLLQKKDGNWMPVSVTFSRIPNEVREEIKVAVIVRDLTERKNMEDIIKALYNEASQKQLEAEIQYRIARKIASVRDFTIDNRQPILQSVAKDINKLLAGDYVGLFLYDFTKEIFDLVAVTEPEKGEKLKRVFDSHMKRSSINFTPSTSTTNVSEERKITIIPLQSEDLTLGYIGIGEKRESIASLHKQELIKSVVNILTISFENVMLYHKMKDIAILEERERLAREMHDGLAQEISSIHMKIEYLKYLIKGKDKAKANHAEISTAIDELNRMVNVAYLEVRQNLFNLRTIVNFDEGFVDSIQKYIEKFSMQNHIQLEFFCDEHQLNLLNDLPEYTKMHVLRILQESLSNVRRHAKAKRVEIRFSSNIANAVQLIIHDNGVGFDPDRVNTVNHYGLSTMKERASLIKGTLDIQSEPHHGTSICLTIPMKEAHIQYG